MTVFITMIVTVLVAMIVTVFLFLYVGFRQHVVGVSEVVVDAFEHSHV